MVPGITEDRWRGGGETAELDLADDDGRLPWLESADDDEQPGAFDTTRLALFGIGAFVLLTIVVGAIWMLANSGLGGEPAADGSVIAAPEGPYKTRPDDAGGKVFAGTGDTSFAVGEGQTRDARLASAAPAPAPQIATTLDDSAEEPQPAQTGGVAVQVGAYSRRDQAEEGWATLLRQTTALAGISHRIVEGQADIGRVFRLQAVMGDRAAANRLCAALQADGLPCQVK